MPAKFKLQQITKLGPFEVWHVDGAEIRKRAEPDFTNFAQPLRFPDLIPSNEIWVDTEASGNELVFYLTHAVAEYTAMARGLSYEDAEEIGKSAEERERSKASTRCGKPRDISDLKLRRLGTTRRGIEVWLVDGEIVRNELFTDFTAGGHDLVFDFIPANEVWVDNDYTSKEWPFIVRHELVEREFMAVRGISYPEAHLKALGYEQELRQDEPSEDLVEISPGAIKVDLPDIRQRTGYSCGASALEAVAKYFGLDVTEEEEYFVGLTEMDTRVGSHPSEIAAAAEKLGLTVEFYEEMSDEELVAELDQHHPVLLTLQAYGPGYDEEVIDYSETYTEGHWVVAIGYDDTGVFFEDPSLEAIRGYISYSELSSRWHDTVQHNEQKERVGIAMWRDGSEESHKNFSQRVP